MKEIIRWLRKIEHSANEVYGEASQIFADDVDFKNFLERNAEDEAWHYHVMGSASEYLASIPDIPSAISVDSATDSRISGYFEEMRVRLQQNTISKEQLIEKIVQAELSEWNDIFLYVVNVLKERTSEFKYPSARIQAHIKNIENFVEKMDSGPVFLEKLKELPPIWVENILIVDDEEMITDILKRILSHSGNIDVASNGMQALQLIEKKFYKLIISDIDMPIMDGLTLYRETVKAFPKTTNRFLFLTGNLSYERRTFFSDNGVRCMQKPVSIRTLREEAEKIICSD